MSRYEYIEVGLHTVLNCWMRDYKPRKGESILSVETFVDTAKEKVIFKVLIHEEKPVKQKNT